MAPAALGGAATALNLPPPPWRPLLSAAQLRRGLAFYGSGRRLERVAAKLLAGQPVKAFTLGGSVTHGAGASRPDSSYPARFFAFLNATFPHPGHVTANKGIGGTTSAIFSLCARALVPPDADLVVVEFTFNEPADLPFPAPQRRAFEQLLRSLARLPGAPALLLLHHYAWWFCSGDGRDAGLYYRPAEQQFATLAQYYDLPSPSVRDAVWHEMRAGTPPFRVSHVLKPGQVSPAGVALPLAPPGQEGQMFFYDRVHPSDVGHQVMAELLAGVLMQAVENVAAGRAARGAPSPGAPAPAQGGGAARDEGRRGGGGGSSDGSGSGSGSGSGRQRQGGGGGGDAAGLQPAAHLEQQLEQGQEPELPPPMIPGNADVPTSVCAMQDEFRQLAVELNGFEWRPERPNGTTPADQKWGFAATRVGATMVLEVGTVDGSAGQGGAAGVYLGYLRSYAGMGVARVACGGGCTCAESSVDAGWRQRVSLTQVHELKATQAERCRVRVTVVGASAAGGDGAPQGAKFQLSSLMVAHFPVVLDQRIAGTARGMVEGGG